MNWLQLPETFVLRHDLGYPARNADAVLQVAQPLLRALQSWLQARHHAVLSLQLRWHHDLRRIDGQELPAWESLCIRTAQPTQGMAHLQRLLREHLGQQHWRAPVDMLELQALKTVPWSAAPLSCLPDLAAQQGSANSLAWHEWVERVGARWGMKPCAWSNPMPTIAPKPCKAGKALHSAIHGPPNSLLNSALLPCPALLEKVVLATIAATPGRRYGRPGCCPGPRPWRSGTIVPTGMGRCSCVPGPIGWSQAGGRGRKHWPCATILWRSTKWSAMSGFTVRGRRPAHG